MSEQGVTCLGLGVVGLEALGKTVGVERWGGSSEAVGEETGEALNAKNGTERGAASLGVVGDGFLVGGGFVGDRGMLPMVLEPAVGGQRGEAWRTEQSTGGSAASLSLIGERFVDGRGVPPVVWQTAEEA